MYFQYTSISALGAITFLTYASTSVAGHARVRPHHAHRHEARAFPLDTDLMVTRRQAAGSIEIPTGEIQLLQSETTSFSGWMSAWFDSANATDPNTSVALLKQEFQAYDGWITAWLGAAIGQGSAPSATSGLLPTSSAASVVAPVATAAPSTAVISAPAGSPASVDSAPASPSSTSTTSNVAAPEKVHSTQVIQQSASSSSSVAAAPSSAPSTSTGSQPPSGGSSSGGSSGSFNAQSNSNVAVYYGQSGATGQVTLAQMCQDQSVDIVVLAFLTTFFGPGGYPTINFGSACGGQSTAMTSKGATGLLNCPTMAQDITTCQGLGKKVLLSLGGSEATSAFSSNQQADQFATQLWNLFGSGTGEDAGLRPFGNVKIDGFDIDNEDHSTAYYSEFVSSLRTQLNQDKSRTYYISAAPQCPRPDASIPLDAMQSMDFVFVQFYNNGDCNVGQPGFADSFKAWSSDLSAKGSGPKLYIGAPGCTACAGSGYVDPSAIAGVIDSVKDVGNLGGVMLWDGPEAKQNTNGGQDYTAVVKAALT